MHVGDAGSVFVVEVNTLNIRSFDAFRLYLVTNHFYNPRYVLMDCLQVYVFFLQFRISVFLSFFLIFSMSVLLYVIMYLCLHICLLVSICVYSIYVCLYVYLPECMSVCSSSCLYVCYPLITADRLGCGGSVIKTVS